MPRTPRTRGAASRGRSRSRRGGASPAAETAFQPPFPGGPPPWSIVQRPDAAASDPALPDVVLLPATAPGDLAHGREPEALAGARLHRVTYAREVWYNAAMRSVAMAQIQALGLRRPWLVGFSKSGLGALLLLADQPWRFAGAVVFDAPVERAELPPWNTADFYDQATWERDRPCAPHRVAAIRGALAAGAQLHLVAGALYGGEMAALAKALGDPRCRFSAGTTPHRWDAGWLESAWSAVRTGR